MSTLQGQCIFRAREHTYAECGVCFYDSKIIFTAVVVGFHRACHKPSFHSRLSWTALFWQGDIASGSLWRCQETRKCERGADSYRITHIHLKSVRLVAVNNSSLKIWLLTIFKNPEANIIVPPGPQECLYSRNLASSKCN